MSMLTEIEAAAEKLPVPQKEALIEFLTTRVRQERTARGDRAFFSVVASEISGTDGDADWQRVEFSPAEFLVEHARFRESLFTSIRAAAPSVAEQWIQRYDPKIRYADK